MKTKFKKKQLYICTAVIVLICLICGLQYIKKHEGRHYNGTLTENDKTSAVTDYLYYLKGDKLMINMDRLDDLINLSVITMDNKYYVVTTYHQITVDANEPSYRLDSVMINDKSQSAPSVIDNGTFADMNAIFNTLGYDVSYTMLKAQNIIHATLTRRNGIDEYDFPKIKIKKQTEETEKDIPQKESDLLNNEESVPTPENESKPDELNKEQAIENAINGTDESNTEETEEYTEIYPDLSNNGTQIKSDQQTSENTETNIDFEKIQSKKLSDLEQALTNRPTNGTVRNGFEISANNTYATQNTEPIGQHASTITYTKNPSSDYDEFLNATFRYDQSDYADEITDDPVAKAYYLSIPETYHNVWCALLGKEQGDELFNYIKPLADRKSIDAKTGKEIADGMQAQTIDFSNFLDRKTSDNLRYSVTHYGDGIQITLFKK